MPESKKKEAAKKGPPKPEMLPLTHILRYATVKQKILAFIGISLSIFAGLIAPSAAIVSGDAIESYNPANSITSMQDKILELGKLVVVVTACLWTFSYVQYAFMQHVAEGVAFNLRTKYLMALMKQETAYFEMQQVEAIPA